MSRVRNDAWILASTASDRACASASALSDSMTERSSFGPSGRARRVGSLTIRCTTRSSSTSGSETWLSSRDRERETTSHAISASSATAAMVPRRRHAASVLA